jgi:hypothetical protein
MPAGGAAPADGAELAAGRITGCLLADKTLPIEVRTIAANLG